MRLPALPRVGGYELEGLLRMDTQPPRSDLVNCCGIAAGSMASCSVNKETPGSLGTSSLSQDREDMSDPKHCLYAKGEDNRE